MLAAKVPPATVEPLSPARYKVQFTASAELQAKLERLRALLRPQFPDGDLGAIIDQHPFALGGDCSLRNIALMCHGHNEYLAERDYGLEVMARSRQSGNRVSKTETVAIDSAATAFTAAGGTGTQAT
jgi:hypothetical protein